MDTALEIAEPILVPDVPDIGGEIVVEAPEITCVRIFTEEDYPLVHRFAPGLYVREVSVPAGQFIVGRKHLHPTVNFLMKGRVSVVSGGRVMHLTAPCTFVSEAGVRKAAIVHEDMIWTNVHATDETDIGRIEKLFIDTSDDARAEEEQCRLLLNSLIEKGLK